jgi:ATP-binding cassette subfamily B protein
MAKGSTEPSPPDGNGVSNAALIGRLLRLAWRYRAGCLKALGIQLLLLTMAVSGLSLTGVGIDFIRHELQPGTTRPPRWPFHLAPPADWSPMGVVTAVAVAVFAFALLRALLTFVYSIHMARLLQGRLVVDLRSRVYDKLQRLSFRFFDDNVSGSIINRVVGDVQATRLFVDGVLLEGFVMLLSLGFYLAYMLYLHPGLTLACLSTTPLLWLMSSIFSRRVRPAYARNRELVDAMILNLSETVQGIHVIKGFAREPEATARFADANRAVRDQKTWLIDQMSRFTPGIGFLTQVNIIILIGYGGYLVIHGALPLGAGLVVFAGLLQQFSGQVANIANIANSAQESLTSARRVFEILDAPLDIRSPAAAVRLPRIRGAVSFDRVRFGYKPGTPVLEDISFDAPPGSCTAILGATGSGKSTLLSLIPRFYDPVSGTVRIDGVDVREIDLDDLRRGIGVVFQENFLFGNTVSENIAFGNPAASRGQVERAARIAAAHDFITALPKGYDTVLGEGGSDLSGGQRQRLAIARAILLEPPILILDDPTASVDPGTEHEILQSMENAMRGRTTFLIAHRISALRRADRILVLDRGRIAQMGTHDALMASRGLYQRLASAQIVDDDAVSPAGQPGESPVTPPPEGVFRHP